MMSKKFSAVIEIIGINPFVFVPGKILDALFTSSGKNKGPIPVKGTINNLPYKQTLVKYAGHWRLYINTVMLKDSPKHTGKKIAITIEHDPEDRSVPFHPKLSAALDNNKKAKKIYESLSPSLQKEINRYIAGLKTAESISKNVDRAIGFLLGRERFVGRPPLQSN
ncbi:MAG: YdeI/OmpD-associated family protein [Agriterribacter sp.]